MEQKKYFYKDKLGRTQKFIYCLRGCPEPYFQEQLGTEIIKVTDHTHICKKCFNDLHMQKDNPKFLISLTKPDITRKTIQDVEDEPEIEPEITEVVSDKKERFFAYVVKCKDNSFYCGVTSNVENAIKNHNSGSGSTYTREKTRRPVCLVASTETNSIIDAKKIKVDYQKEYKEIN
jgi:putative endonuclease